jgi:hypothetical protein
MIMIMRLVWLVGFNVRWEGGMGMAWHGPTRKFQQEGNGESA